jgi:hypothetical protein
MFPAVVSNILQSHVGHINSNHPPHGCKLTKLDSNSSWNWIRATVQPIRFNPQSQRHDH